MPLRPLSMKPFWLIACSSFCTMYALKLCQPSLQHKINAYLLQVPWIPIEPLALMWECAVCNVKTCSNSKLQLWMWSVVYCKVLAVFTAVWHLYHARAHTTWCWPTAYVRSALYISTALVCTIQRQRQGPYIHHSLLGYSLALWGLSEIYSKNTAKIVRTPTVLGWLLGMYLPWDSI